MVLLLTFFSTSRRHEATYAISGPNLKDWSNQSKKVTLGYQHTHPNVSMVHCMEMVWVVEGGGVVSKIEMERTTHHEWRI